MSKKLKNLEKMWDEAGYFIDVRETRFLHGTLMEVDMFVQNKDGRQLKFFDEWKEMKALAKRQDFYLIPVHERNGRVILLERTLINLVDSRLQAMEQQVRKNYWYLQGNDEVRHHRIQLQTVSIKANTLQSDINFLGNCRSSAFDNVSRDLHERYQGLYGLFYDVYQSMDDSGFYSEDDLAEHVKLINRFQGED